MNSRRIGQCISSITLVVTIGANTFAKDDVERFDNGPFFSQANQFISVCSSMLNTAENSQFRLKSIALGQRVAGGREEQARDLATRTADELARFFIMSADSWAGSASTIGFIRTFSSNPNVRGLAQALEMGVARFPDGSEIRAPIYQRMSIYEGDILVTGGALLERDTPRQIAGEYTATVNGECAFGNGSVEIVQDKFLLEGQRAGGLLFWGAIGETRAYFATAENKYLKITLRRRGKGALVEFPDKASELFSAKLDDPVLSLRGEFFGECEIELTPQDPVPGTVKEPPPTRLVQDPPEQAVERVDTPGVSLEMQETSRSGSGCDLEVTYKVTAQGFPSDLTYSLWRFRPQPEPVRIMENLTVDESGAMIVNECGCDDPEWTPAPIETALPIILETISPGEAFEFGIRSNDHSVEAYATVYPVPLEVTDGDCRLILERLNPGQTAYRAHVTGLTPGEKLRIESDSGGVVLHSSEQADAYGRFSAYVFPEVLGKQNGQAKYRLYAEYCQLHIDYHWGVRPPES